MISNTERWYPLVLAGIASVACCFACWYFELDLVNALPKLLSATVSFGAIVFGFVGTSLSILTSLGTPVMRKIRRTHYLKQLRNYLGWAMASGILLSLISIMGIFLSLTATWFAAIWCFILVFCIACLYRLANVMLSVFSHPENMPN